jgi:hypothetical protein
VIDLAGRTFARWTVLRRAGRNRSGKILWRCRCECGNESDVVGANLMRGISTQCRHCADTHADHGGPRCARPKPAKPCIWCGQPFVPKRVRAKYCSPACKQKYRWSVTDKAAHNQRVCAAQKNKFAGERICRHCGKKFIGPPKRLYCSPACVEQVKASGKYRHKFNAARGQAQIAAAAAKLGARTQ